MKAEVMRDWLTVAFEGGITYWAEAARPCAGQMDDGPCVCDRVLGEKIPYSMVDAEPGWYQNEEFYRDVGNSVLVWGDEEDGGVYVFSLCKLQEMIENWCMTRPCTLEDFDADDADCVVQLACFGKVVYG